MNNKKKYVCSLFVLTSLEKKAQTFHNFLTHPFYYIFSPRKYWIVGCFNGAEGLGN